MNKLMIIIFLFLLSFSTFADDSVWNLMPSFQNCYYKRNLRATENVSDRNWMEGDGKKAAPVTKTTAGEILNIPSCKNAVFAGVNPDEYFAISNTSAYFSKAPRAGKKRKWEKIVDYKDRLLGLTDARMSFDPINKVVAWVGFVPSNGVNHNYMVIWDLATNGRTERIEIGSGFNGMSGIMMNSAKKEVVVASIDWCAQVLAYDFTGKVVREFPNINGYFNDKHYCLDLNNYWLWNVDFGRDKITGDFLFYYSSSNHEDYPEPKYGHMFRLSLDSDVVLEE